MPSPPHSGRYSQRVEKTGPLFDQVHHLGVLTPFGDFWAESVRVGTEIGLKDRFPYPCPRALDPPIPNAGNLQGSHFSVRLRDGHFSMGLWLVGSGLELCSTAF